jgi:glycosyltransferase involved in cell wall biosynthesis
MNSKAPEVSIIVRTYNEERWIGHCLGAIFNQDFDNFEVILVDNNSTDHTVEVAKRYPVSTIVKIDKFFPGKALNDGIRASTGNYIVCISAHCIPKDEQWLRNLYNNFDENEKLAGVYGRQLPLSYTSDADKRDLLIAFGQDKKVQVKDYFFHNANSMLPRAIWDEFPFEEEATNIDDRIWGKLVIEAGYKIIYEPSASVYHYHGLHQHGNSSDRAKGIATILDKLDAESIGDLPESLKPENIGVASILLVNEQIDENSLEFKLLLNAVEELKLVSYVNEIYIAAHDENIAILSGTQWIDRNKSTFNANDINVEELLSLSLKEIESKGSFPGVILYVNHHYPFRPVNLFDELITELQYMGLSSVFPCFIDYGHYWKKDTCGSFLQIDSSMDSRTNREPIMRALYGLGCATSSAEIRKGNITGNDVGIVSIDNYQFTLNSREIGSQEIIKKLLNY